MCGFRNVLRFILFWLCFILDVEFLAFCFVFAISSWNKAARFLWQSLSYCIWQLLFPGRGLGWMVNNG